MKYLIYYDELAKLLYEDKSFHSHKIVPQAGNSIELPGEQKIYCVRGVIFNYNTNVIAVILKESLI